MSKIKLVNLTEGYLIVNSIEINKNKLSIPPKTSATVDAEYEDDSHVQELVRMGRIRIAEYVPEQAKSGQKKSHHKAKEDKDGEPAENQDGRKATFMSAQGQPKKTAMVNSLEKDQVTKKPVDNGPLIDPQDEEDAENDAHSDAFVNV